jgi:hypothetical protein
MIADEGNRASWTHRSFVLVAQVVDQVFYGVCGWNRCKRESAGRTFGVCVGNVWSRDYNFGSRAMRTKIFPIMIG